MKITYYLILAILVLLAISSGVTKIMLMPQDVEFFGKYGFTDPLLIVFGVVQLVGGVLLLLSKTRRLGAIAVAITFLISFVLLVMSKSFPIAIVTLACTALLVFLIKKPNNP